MYMKVEPPVTAGWLCHWWRGVLQNYVRGGKLSESSHSDCRNLSSSNICMSYFYIVWLAWTVLGVSVEARKLNYSHMWRDAFFKSCKAVCVQFHWLLSIDIQVLLLGVWETKLCQTDVDWIPCMKDACIKCSLKVIISWVYIDLLFLTCISHESSVYYCLLGLRDVSVNRCNAFSVLRLGRSIWK